LWPREKDWKCYCLEINSTIWRVHLKILKAFLLGEGSFMPWYLCWIYLIVIIIVLQSTLLTYLLTYLQFSVIKWAKQRPGQKTQLTLSLMKQFRSNRLTLH
jgi:hypothetical protein